MGRVEQLDNWTSEDEKAVSLFSSDVERRYLYSLKLKNHSLVTFPLLNLGTNFGKSASSSSLL